jgi:hypothetical protein
MSLLLLDLKKKRINFKHLLLKVKETRLSCIDSLRCEVCSCGSIDGINNALDVLFRARCSHGAAACLMCESNRCVAVLRAFKIVSRLGRASRDA